jgi:hypothetical protein
MTPEDLDKMAADWVKAHYCLRLTPMIEATGRDMAAFARAVAAACYRDAAERCLTLTTGAYSAMAQSMREQADALAAPERKEEKAC